MKRAVWLMWLLVPVSLTVLFWAGLSGGEKQVVAAPPLSLDGFMDEKLPEAPKEKVKLKVDNLACFVCHGNYEDEPLVIEHAKKAIGCVDCHGQSHDHRNDEDNITPPDKMYAPEDVDKMCGECHEKHNAQGKEVIARWRERCPAKTDPEKIVCTDCHFQHRLKFRTVWWNKKTGELVIRGKERIKVAPDLTKPAAKPKAKAQDDK